MSNIFDLFKKIETPKDTGPITHIVVGLGNPGAQYEKTRHNAGFLAIDYIAEKLSVRIDRLKFSALTAEAVIGEHRVLLMKPETFMNNSGKAIAEAASFYKIPAENIIVLHDEISFDAGNFRIRRKGSAGGHNGLKSIIASISSDAFPRIKLGVGKKPTPEYDLVDWVLGKFSKDELTALASRFADVYDAVTLMVKGDIDGAMCKHSH